MDNGLRAAPIFLYRFWLNGVGVANFLAVLDASLALASSLPPIASSPLPSIFYCLLGDGVLAPRPPRHSRVAACRAARRRSLATGVGG